MSDFARTFEGNTIMSFKIIDNCYKSTIKYGVELKNYCKQNLITNLFIVMMINKYIKTKIKIYASGMITNFQSKKMPKEKAP